VASRGADDADELALGSGEDHGEALLLAFGANAGALYGLRFPLLPGCVSALVRLASAAGSRGGDGRVRQELATAIGRPASGGPLGPLPPATNSRSTKARWPGRRTGDERFATFLLPNSVAQGETGQHGMELKPEKSRQIGAI
jgi:hypothetical protein